MCSRLIRMFFFVWFRRNFSYDDVHVKVARNIARLARECGVQRLIHFSALNASPNPTPIVLRKPSRFLQSKVKIRSQITDFSIFSLE